MIIQCVGTGQSKIWEHSAGLKYQRCGIYGVQLRIVFVLITPFIKKEFKIAGLWNVYIELSVCTSFLKI